MTDLDQQITLLTYACKRWLSLEQIDTIEFYLADKNYIAAFAQLDSLFHPSQLNPPTKLLMDNIREVLLN